MEAIERLTQRIQGNFNRRKEWDEVLACAGRLAKDRLDELSQLRESNPGIMGVDKERAQLAKTINGLGWLRDLKDHQ